MHIHRVCQDYFHPLPEQAGPRGDISSKYQSQREMDSDSQGLRPTERKGAKTQSCAGWGDERRHFQQFSAAPRPSRCSESAGLNE